MHMKIPGDSHQKVLKYYGHKCFEGLLYKCVKMYLCKSYISGLNGYVFLNVFAVEAYVASWIEIPFYFYTAYLQDRRGLCSLVDWNMDIK